MALLCRNRARWHVRLVLLAIEIPVEGAMDQQLRQLLQFFVANGTLWVQEQRNRLRPFGLPLSAEHRTRLQMFYSAKTLDVVRVVEVPKIENPGFYSILEQAGWAVPLDFGQMAGITFGDTIAISIEHAESSESRTPLIFHELVHVVQYGALGIDRFIQRYVAGWASSGFNYYGIPLEQDAYSLQAAFENGMAPNDIEAEIVRRLFLD